MSITTILKNLLATYEEPHQYKPAIKYLRKVIYLKYNYAKPYNNRRRGTL